MVENKKTVEITTKKKSSNKFQWFLIIIIPIFFTILVTLIVLTVAGVNVFQWSKEVGSKMPVIAELFEEDKEPSKEEYEGKLVDLEGEIKDQEVEIVKLNNIIASKDQEINQLDIDKQRLEKELEDMQAAPVEETKKDSDIIKTYEQMSAKKTAAIITALNDEEAINILMNLKNDTVAAILEKMAPKDAARLTTQLAKESE
ncbi:MAG: MotE family protein [Bacillus sp. (in: firmicutes)]